MINKMLDNIIESIILWLKAYLKENLNAVLYTDIRKVLRAYSKFMQQTKGINSYENIVLLVYVRTGKEYGIFLKWDLIA